MRRCSSDLFEEKVEHADSQLGEGRSARTNTTVVLVGAAKNSRFGMKQINVWHTGHRDGIRAPDQWVSA